MQEHSLSRRKVAQVEGGNQGDIVGYKKTLVWHASTKFYPPHI